MSSNKRSAFVALYIIVVIGVVVSGGAGLAYYFWKKDSAKCKSDDECVRKSGAGSKCDKAKGACIPPPAPPKDCGPGTYMKDGKCYIQDIGRNPADTSGPVLSSSNAGIILSNLWKRNSFSGYGLPANPTYAPHTFRLYGCPDSSVQLWYETTLDNFQTSASAWSATTTGIIFHPSKAPYNASKYYFDIDPATNTVSFKVDIWPVSDSMKLAVNTDPILTCPARAASFTGEVRGGLFERVY